MPLLIMAEPVKPRTSRHTVRRARIIASLMPLGSLAVLLGAAAVTSGLSIEAFFALLTSPLVVLVVILFLSILFPAYMRIYYVLLLDAKGGGTASERRAHQAGKQRWEGCLLRAALVAGVLLAGLAVWVRWH
jgi:hypothetical protein